MLTDTPSVTQLSQVISQSAAPAFLLGALGAFIAILISRLNRIVDRSVILNGILDDDTVRQPPAWPSCELRIIIEIEMGISWILIRV
jgi:hypothetical protein